MNPDEILITVASAIGGACLLSLLVALLVLANIEHAPTPLPAHYVLPYIEPRPLMEQVDPEPTNLQRRAVYRQNPSDEYLPRNATPGPSNVPRTPPPAYDPTEAEDYGRYLRAWFGSPTSDLPLIMIPDSPEPTFGEEPARRPPSSNSNSDSENPEQIRIYQPCPHTLPTSPIRVMLEPLPHLCPLPDLDSDSDSSSYGGNEPIPKREDDDPLNPHGADYEWPSLDAIDRTYLGPYRSHAWEIRRVNIENRKDPHYQYTGEMPPFRPIYSPIEIEPSDPPQQGTNYEMYDPAPGPNNRHWSTPYSHSHSWRVTDLIWTALSENQFDDFNYDEETFGWNNEEDDQFPGDYRGFTMAPFYDLPQYPFPLPDAPPQQVCQHGQYHGPRTSRYYAAQGDSAGGSTEPPIDPNTKKRWVAAEEAGAKLCRITKLEKELNDMEMEHRDHAVQWGLPLRPEGKGKDPDRGRLPLPQPPNSFRPLWKRDDQYSIP
ncbi:uncharacterized protein ARMOST_22215 [Armillaria ostoyae]|uniref:Uncharacterized protein n=1 Tax=Armillaria ostoyae TaxID=47428 RepID=A0A284SC81_ARMOS|nr:uncharacterized protein ARMOST_22215 [Armillaria ostoyae]